MAVFTYRAMDGLGRVVRGNLDALNALDLEMRLKRMHLDLITERMAKKPRRYFGSARIRRKELINFCFHLEQLLRAGVPIIEALVDLRDSTTVATFRGVLANTTEAIEGGKRLSEALADHPDVFDSVFVNLVRSGEESGRLPEVLQKLTDNLKWQDEISAQTRRLTLYPIFTGVVVLGMIFYLLIYLVPKLAMVIKTLQPKLPIETEILLAVSQFFVNYWYLMLAAPVVLFFIARTIVKRDPEYQRKLDGLLLELPIVGPVLKKIILARFATFFALMYQSGIGVLDCIRIAERIVGNRVIESALQQAGHSIGEGKSLSAAFTDVGVFPPLVLRMLRVGESTGNLDDALNNVSYFYNRDINESIASVQQVIQPAMILILGLIMLAVLLPVFGPIYDAIGNVKF